MRKYTFVFALALAFGFAPFCSAQAAQPKRPMTFEDMMKMKRLGETAVSPDGKWLAYSVTTVESGAEHEDGGAVDSGDCGRRADEAGRGAGRATRGCSLRPMGTPCSFFPVEMARNRYGWRILTRRPARQATRRS